MVYLKPVISKLLYFTFLKQEGVFGDLILLLLLYVDDNCDCILAEAIWEYFPLSGLGEVPTEPEKVCVKFIFGKEEFVLIKFIFLAFLPIGEFLDVGFTLTDLFFVY